jgi:hypothetical protein
MEVIEKQALARRWLVSSGLGAREQLEVAVPLVGDTAGERLTAESLLRMIDSYTATQPRRAAAGETMAWNIDRVRLRAANDIEAARLDAKLVVQEAADPLRDGDAFVDGMQALARIDDQQRDVFRRFKLQNRRWANRAEAAVVCRRLAEARGRFSMSREPTRRSCPSCRCPKARR